MMRARIAAAQAAVVTALLLQATLVAPVATFAQLSLPAVLVAAIAVNCGPGTGISVGFGAGLVADLGSTHPAGVLALCWLCLGVVCGLLGETARSLRAQVVLIGVGCAVSGSFVTLLLTVLGAAGATARAAAGELLPSIGGDLLLALIVTPVVRWFLRSQALRVPAAGHG